MSKQRTLNYLNKLISEEDRGGELQCGINQYQYKSKLKKEFCKNKPKGNPWIKFLKDNANRGYTRKELKSMYHEFDNDDQYNQEEMVGNALIGGKQMKQELFNELEHMIDMKLGGAPIGGKYKKKSVKNDCPEGQISYFGKDKMDHCRKKAIISERKKINPWIEYKRRNPKVPLKELSKMYAEAKIVAEEEGLDGAGLLAMLL